MEYKEAHQKFSNTNEIGKDVSAFANRKGGLIFYGVKCDPSDPFTTLIKGLQKKIIPNHAPKVMLVYVPQSDESPHQNSDGKYYMQSGSEIRRIASLLS